MKTAIGACIGLAAGAAALLPVRNSAAILLGIGASVLCWWSILAPNRWLQLFLFAVLLLPPLPFALGDSGPHPAMLFAALGLVAGVLRLSDWKLRPDWLSAAIPTYFLALAVTVPLAGWYSGLDAAAGSLARILLAGVSGYVFFYATAGPGRAQFDGVRTARFLFACGTAAAAFACIDFYYQLPAPAGFSAQFVWLDSGVFRRAQGLFYDASALGNVCAFFLVMIAVALVRPPGGRFLRRGTLLAGGAILLTALVASYSRGSVVNLAIACATLVATRTRSAGSAGRAAALIASGLGAALLVYLFFPSFAGPYWLRLQASAQYLFTSPEGVLSGRLETWRTIRDFLITHPWHALLGIGYKTLPYSSLLGRPVVADNVYLGMLVETGVIGVSALVFLCGAILRSAWKAARTEDATAGFFGTWMFCFWVGQMFQMLSGDLLTYWRALPLYFWLMAAAKVSADEYSLRRPVQ